VRHDFKFDLKVGFEVILAVRFPSPKGDLAAHDRIRIRFPC
jgi:hypothetical protein